MCLRDDRLHIDMEEGMVGKQEGHVLKVWYTWIQCQGLETHIKVKKEEIPRKIYEMA